MTKTTTPWAADSWSDALARLTVAGFPFLFADGLLSECFFNVAAVITGFFAGLLLVRWVYTLINGGTVNEAVVSKVNSLLVYPYILLLCGVAVQYGQAKISFAIIFYCLAALYAAWVLIKK